MICRNCGGNISNNYNCCPYCGLLLATNSQTNNQKSTSYRAQNKYSQQNNQQYYARNQNEATDPSRLYATVLNDPAYQATFQVTQPIYPRTVKAKKKKVFEGGVFDTMSELLVIVLVALLSVTELLQLFIVFFELF